MQRGENRPHLLQMSNYTVYFNAKRRYGSGQERRNGQQLVLCQSAAQCPVQHCMQTTNLCAFANSREARAPVPHAWLRHGAAGYSYGQE